MDTFQSNPSVRVALLGLTAAGIGITLTAASRCVLAGRQTNLMRIVNDCHERIRHRSSLRALSVRDVRVAIKAVGESPNDYVCHHWHNPPVAVASEKDTGCATPIEQLYSDKLDFVAGLAPFFAEWCSLSCTGRQLSCFRRRIVVTALDKPRWLKCSTWWPKEA